MVKELKGQVNFFVQNKVFVLTLILAAILGYGYEITHSTLGVDDACIELYFGEGLGLAIGRWPFYVINKLFHVAEYSPVFLDTLAVLILMFAAVLWCSLIRYILKKQIPMICYAIFAAMFIDYSLIAEVFIFTLQNGVCIIYCLVAVALFAMYYMLNHAMEKKKKIQYITGISMLVSLAIGFYESAAALFLSGVLIVLLFDMCGENRLAVSQMKSLFSAGFLTVRVLAYAIIARSIINKVCMAIFQVEAYGYRSVSDSLWIFENPGKMINIALETIRDYFAVAGVYYPIKVFLIAMVLFWIILFIEMFKQKRYMMLPVGTCLVISMFLIGIFQGEGLPYRAAQAINVFVAAVFFAASAYLMKTHKPIRYVGLILVFSLIYNSAFDLTQWFKLDYEKNQIELDAVHQIIDDLDAIGYIPYGDKGKPVVFIGEFTFNDGIVDQYSIQTGHTGYDLVRKINDYLEIPPYYRYSYVDTLSNSLLNWGVRGMSEYKSYNSMMYWIFRMEGYQISTGTNEMYEEALEHLYDMPDFPEEGYIKEYDEYIVIKL